MRLGRQPRTSGAAGHPLRARPAPGIGTSRKTGSPSPSSGPDRESRSEGRGRPEVRLLPAGRGAGLGGAAGHAARVAVVRAVAVRASEGPGGSALPAAASNTTAQAVARGQAATWIASQLQELERRDTVLRPPDVPGRSGRIGVAYHQPDFVLPLDATQLIGLGAAPVRRSWSPPRPSAPSTGAQASTSSYAPATGPGQFRLRRREHRHPAGGREGRRSLTGLPGPRRDQRARQASGSSRCCAVRWWWRRAGPGRS